VAPLSQDIELRELPQEFLDQLHELDAQEDEIVREWTANTVSDVTLMG
jgi:hypothetical protein